MNLTTPYYLIHEDKLLKNLRIIERVKNASGAKVVLALKCFSTWSTFPLIRKYLDGTTSSSLYEARLGKEKFKKEVHAYSVSYSKDEISEITKYADKVIFNSVSQLKMFYQNVKGLNVGLRINPSVSYSHFDLANPARKYSRLGVTNLRELSKAASYIKGAMFHFNCENDDFNNFSSSLDLISRKYSNLLNELNWVSLGGGIAFTKPGYPVDKFALKLKKFSERFKLQVYLEPGEAVITQSSELITKVLDVVKNRINIAVVDASTEAHMLDLLIYRLNAKIKTDGKGNFKYMIAGRSCLAGDIFGIYKFKSKLKVGSTIKIADAAGYTMVKKNWFNGLSMPAIVIRRLNGTLDIVRRFGYDDFLNSLS